MESTPGEVTRLLKAMNDGDAEAAKHLLPLVYQELHRIAAAYMRRCAALRQAGLVTGPNVPLSRAEPRGFHRRIFIRGVIRPTFRNHDPKRPHPLEN